MLKRFRFFCFHSFGSYILGLLLNKTALNEEMIFLEAKEAIWIIAIYYLKICSSWQMTHFDFPVDFWLRMWMALFPFLFSFFLFLLKKKKCKVSKYWFSMLLYWLPSNDDWWVYFNSCRGRVNLTASVFMIQLAKMNHLLISAIYHL